VVVDAFWIRGSRGKIPDAAENVDRGNPTGTPDESPTENDVSNDNVVAPAAEVQVDTIFDSDETVLGQEYSYPTDGSRARITAQIITLLPGASTPVHVHTVPLFFTVLEGALTVDYYGLSEEGGGGATTRRTYHVGDSNVEALSAPHRGRNDDNAVDVKLLAVYAGAVGVPLSEPAAFDGVDP